MRKILKRLCVISAVLAVISGGFNVYASDNTTYTYTVSVDGEWVKTQDAYIPAAVYAKGTGLSQPGDVFYKNGKLYISDSGNARIAVYDIASSETEFFGGDELKAPDGLFVTDDGTIYAADPQAQAVFVYDASHKLKMTIGRPDSYLFSKTSLYSPCAVAVSSVGNIFVVGDGAYEGIMQFDSKGEFFGYFAANKYKMTMTERFQELIYNARQKETLMVRTPRPVNNIDVSQKDLIFSVTRSDDMQGITYASTSDDTLKMHNMAGLNIFAESGKMKEEWNFTDVAAGLYGNVFAVTQTGIINEYDSQGNLVFTFGGRAYDDDRNGIFTNAVAIDVDDESGILYVLDQDRALVQVFYPTDFANLTHSAVAALDKGDYESSEEIWAGLLRLNGMSQIAHMGYGKALFYQQKYKAALEHFKIANNTEYYSDAFWELRNEWLNRNIGYIFLCVILIVALLIIRSVFRKKHKKMAAEKPVSGAKRFLKETAYIKTMLRHPIDGYYYLRRGEHGSVMTATVIYLLFFGVYLLDVLGRGYLFGVLKLSTTNPVSVLIMFWVPLLLWLAGNYMIGTINEGEGSFKQIYVATAYAFAPYILITPFIVILSYGLTLNEAFIVNLGSLFVIAWAACLVFMSVKDIQRYSFGETVKNIFLVFFFMIMVIVAVCIVYLLFGQLVVFIKEIFGEGVYRAGH